MMRFVSERKRRATWMVIAAAALSAGCRDGVVPFMTEPRGELEGDPYRLTYSHARDFNPTWSINSDTVFYSTEHFADEPHLNATMIRIARTGGIATLLAPNAAPDTLPRLVLPAPSPDGSLIAYIHFPIIRPAATCGMGGAACTNSQPLIEEGFVRIRDPRSTALVGFDDEVPVVFAGRNPGTSINGIDTYYQQLFPFQQAFAERREFLMRPSWAPAGDRLVFSDGLALRTWDLSSFTTTVIPNTADGVSPAWSPAGNTIAFTRLFREDSTMITCRCQDPPGGTVTPTPIHNRWLYTVSSKVITLVDPEGSAAVDLVVGEDPAWSPDGAFIYFVADNRINRIPVTGGAVVPIPGTLEGRAPAVSPDGQWLAFTKQSDEGRNNDIWITRLSAQ